jgi:hypothetical protein
MDHKLTNMDTKFTPGPWKFANGDTLYSDADGFTQIAVFMNDDDWEVEQLANKALAEQAPAMYIELLNYEKILTALKGEGYAVGGKLDKVGKVLAAARGEKISEKTEQ